MSNMYLNQYGTTFYVDDVGYHSFRDWGLYPHEKPIISPPKVKTSGESVPGSNTYLDFTEILTGYPTYERRKGTFPFVIFSRKLWDTAYEQMSNAIHGKNVRIIRDEEPGWFWYGRAAVSKVSTSRKGAFFLTVEADLDPFKRSVTNTIDPWLWDPFSFYTGVIRQYGGISVDGTKAVTIVSSPEGGCPIFTVTSGSLTLTYGSNTYSLSTGNNQFEDIELPHNREEVEMTFTGTGVVSIWFRPGVL